MKKPLALALAIAAVPFAQADDEGLPDDGADLPVVLSATRLRQSIVDAPAAISVIDRQMIDQSGVRELPELLRLVPGMVVGYDNGWNAFVSYHGTSADMARRMQVLVDGRSVYQPTLAEVNWVGLPLELSDIDRIEVVRGPNAAAYGANSVLGVVNIITRHPADLPTVRAYTHMGADGIQDHYASGSGSKGPYSWSVSVNNRHDDGFTTFFNRENLKDSAGKNVLDSLGRKIKIFTQHPFDDDKRERSAYGQMAWEPDTETSLRMSAGRSELRGQEMPDIRPDTDPAKITKSDMTSRQDYVSMLFSKDLANHQLQLQADYSGFTSKEHLYANIWPALFLPELRQMYLKDRVFTSDFVNAAGSGDTPAFSSDPAMYMLEAKVLCKVMGVSLPGAPCNPADADPKLTQPVRYQADNENSESRTEAELQDTWTLSPTLRMVYGAGIQTSNANSDDFFGGRVENTVWRAFAHGEWQFRPDWRLNLGAMDEHDDYSGHMLSPRAAVNWRFAPTQSFRVVTSRAYRTPDLRETSSYWQYNATTVDRSLSKYDGAYYFLGISPHGYTCTITDNFGTTYPNNTVCTNGAPVERITSREIGYYGEFPKQHVQMDLRIYHDILHISEHNLEIDDFVLAPTTMHHQRGMEFSSQWRPLPNWRFLLNYAYDDITGDNDNTDFVPLHSGNVAAWYDNPDGLRSSLTYVFYNQLYNDSDGGLFFDRLDWSLGKRWRLGKRQQVELSSVWQIRLTEDTELRRANGAPRDKVWLGMSYTYDL